MPESLKKSKRKYFSARKPAESPAVLLRDQIPDAGQVLPRNEGGLQIGEPRG